jgi:hypothetical protein
MPSVRYFSAKNAVSRRGYTRQSENFGSINRVVVNNACQHSFSLLLLAHTAPTRPVTHFPSEKQTEAKQKYLVNAPIAVALEDTTGILTQSLESARSSFGAM